MTEINNKKENLTECKDQESKRQYLQFIQDVITRHNTNSFQIKEFSIAIIAAVYGIFIARENLHHNFLLIPFFTTVLLGFLDTIYLMQEKQFRDLFKDAINDKVDIYSMDISNYEFCFFKVLFSKTIGLFYGALIVTILIVKFYFF